MQIKHPSREECLKILKEYQTPERVIRHCMAVTNVAGKIASKLGDKGFLFNHMLVQSGGLLHDIARVHDEHWEVGSAFILERGYVQEAEIIKKHMTYSLDPNPMKLRELDIVCLGDRIVLEDEYVGIDVRMDYVISKAGGDKRIEAIINERRKVNKILIKNIEEIIEISIEKLILE